MEAKILLFFIGFCQLTQKAAMRQFYVVLVDHGIVHGGVDFDVAEELLDLLNGHAFVDGHGCQCPAELVGMHPWHLGFLANLAQAYLDA